MKLKKTNNKKYNIRLINNAFYIGSKLILPNKLKL